MPQLGISVDRHFEHKAPPADKYGRRIRHVAAVENPGERASLMNPLYLKLAAGLVILATLSMSVALWRLFSFPH